MSKTTLTLAEQALHSPEGADGALALLEEQVVRNSGVANDSAVWACIAHLRRKVGDIAGAEEATLKAREIAGVAPRKLSFDEEKGDAGVARRVVESTPVAGDLDKGRGQRLVKRSKVLRELCQGILGDVEGASNDGDDLN